MPMITRGESAFRLRASGVRKLAREHPRKSGIVWRLVVRVGGQLGYFVRTSPAAVAETLECNSHLVALCEVYSSTIFVEFLEEGA